MRNMLDRIVDEEIDAASKLYAIIDVDGSVAEGICRRIAERAFAHGVDQRDRLDRSSRLDVEPASVEEKR